MSSVKSVMDGHTYPVMSKISRVFHPCLVFFLSVISSSAFLPSLYGHYVSILSYAKILLLSTDILSDFFCSELHVHCACFIYTSYF